MKKLNFTLSRKNQKGQVAIFVALIFQVIFVFFALLVNVGLLVHHKINLQQSTDLAAYYGAMKQAESLNAMAHVNYQIRQAWKLLTWRYRVFGTFGMQRENSGGLAPMFPITLGANGSSVVPDLSLFDSKKCANGANSAETPFFCIGHAGINGWQGGPNENMCQVNCALLNNTLYTVPGVSNPLNVTSVGNAKGLHDELTKVNTKLKTLCQSLAPANIKILAQIILAYRQEMIARSQTLNMIAGNLTNQASDFLDLDGKKVVDGVQNTLKNNLTEANNDQAVLKISAYNSLSSNECNLDRSQPASKQNVGKKEFIKRIEFEFINFFMHSCHPKNNAANNSFNQQFNPGSIFKKDLSGLADGESIPGLSIPTMNISPPLVASSIQDEIMKLIANDNEKFTVGYEKNPWCPAYFVVQASTKPKIPFLPLAEIKINAVSVAKPFGGSLGPWYGKKWERDASNTQTGLLINDVNKQTDETLPMVNRITEVPTKLQDTSRLLLNFSRFVGDTKGVSDPYYLAEYHGALINHKPVNSSLFGGVRTSESGNNSLSPPLETPSMNTWSNMIDFNIPDYDPLVGGSNNKDSFLRDLEISAIAPNQFDLTYYSIDADFYNNYYKRLSDPAIYNKLKTASGGLGPGSEKYIRPDFGNNKNIYPGKEDFSVRNQIEIVKKVFADSGFNTGLPNASPKFIDEFPELARKQSSLLTGWTFKNFTDFETFPGSDMGPTDTMNFARCKDQWQDSGGQPEYKIPKEIDSNLPSTPGNCVTGGRVGYSVKLVSPSVLSNTFQQSLGGPGAQPGVILNPIPSEYLNNFE